MIQKIIANRASAHWYNPKSAAPVFEVPKKDGKGTKKTTVKEAREMGLVPSVTTILRVLDKPELTNWRISKAIEASLELKQLPEESNEDFINRIIDKAEEQSTTAKDFGIKTHEAIEAYIDKGEALNPAIAQILSKFNTFKSECSYSNELVAGTIDITCLDSLGTPVLIDVKTQKSTPDKKFNVYDDYILQLAAYDLLKPSQKYYVLFVSSTEENRVELVEVPCAEIDKAKEIFECLRKTFCWKNKLVY